MKPSLIGEENFEKTSKNGLMCIRVSFGMTRHPAPGPVAGPAEVKAGFADVVASLREFADMLEKVNATESDNGG